MESVRSADVVFAEDGGVGIFVRPVGLAFDREIRLRVAGGRLQIEQAGRVCVELDVGDALGMRILAASDAIVMEVSDEGDGVLAVHADVRRLEELM
jgi:hypothetical protein